MQLLKRFRERRANRAPSQKKGSLYAIWLVIDLLWILFQLATLKRK